MAKEKAQSVKETPEREEAQAAISTDALNEIVGNTEDAGVKALVPALQTLPETTVGRIVELLESMTGTQAGMEEMDSGWTPAIIKVRQPVTTDVPKTIAMGGLYTDDGEALPEDFKFIPLYMYPANVMFEDGNNTPACRSEDGVTSIFGKLCKDCDNEPWKHGDPTDCNKYRNVFLLDVEFKRVYKLALGKTSYRTGTKLMKWMKGSGKAVWSRIYTLSSKEIERKGGGVYYVYDVDATGEKISDPALLQVGDAFNKRIKEAREAYLVNLQARQNRAGEQASKIVERSAGDDIPTSADAAEPDFGKDGAL